MTYLTVPQACNAALENADSYNHSSTPTWNANIIVQPPSRRIYAATNTVQNKILESLISETKTKDAPSPFKFAVNSTIIQHQAAPKGEDSGPGGRRGMHSASGAYWNNEKDGMWNMKYDGGEKIGMDVVVSIMWIAV